jgi:hypothetical protein
MSANDAKLTFAQLVGLLVCRIFYRKSLGASRISEPRVLSRDDHLADRPKRYSGKLQMRPSKGDADYGYGEENCGDERQTQIKFEDLSRDRK